MPIYCYKCNNCGRTLEEIRSMKDAKLVKTCIKCVEGMMLRDLSAETGGVVKFNCDMSHTSSQGRPTTKDPRGSNYGYGAEMERGKADKAKFNEKIRKPKGVK